MLDLIRPACLAAVLLTAGASALPALAEPIGSNATTDVLAASEYSRADVQAIVRTAAEADPRVPTSLALAVARVESNFNAKAESHKGARGVMQIMPATALYDYGIAPELLWDPVVNAELGVRFLGDLYDTYGESWDAALSHYNGGSLRNGRPHAYTASYVTKVNRWTRQYANEPPQPILIHNEPPQLLGAPGSTPTIPPLGRGTTCICGDDSASASIARRNTPPPALTKPTPPRSTMTPITGSDRAPGWRARAATQRMDDARARVRSALAAQGAYD